ncbi:LuxR family transcriptional regulator [Serratia sp. DD3]|uniref:LuxR family transcriptional regulator n=1 Tax=Serratia sp. DD3 TaxID=1410619 RepID=UPI0004D36939|nr:LuxR family transcriptional regulator [Serratia sp. DD3]KEY59591.1 transcriptional activator protein EsaR [Serratia sp. DD3]
MLSVLDKNQIITETLQDYIDRKLSSIGSPKYAYTVINKKNPSDILVISNYPDEWIKFYRTNNLQLSDPVILAAFKRTSPFAWDENITLMTDKIFSFAKRYNIVNGFTFVLHDHMNNLALLSVIIPDNLPGALGSPVSAERGAMQILLIDINEQMYRLANCILSSGQSKAANSDKAIFTSRENEVLYWASMGKTYAEIASITNISTSTVKFHVNNVVVKLGVSNVRQAIRLGVELALITPTAALAR